MCEKEQYSIAILCVYILDKKGTWPLYLEAFLKSCKYNSSINFVIITDDESVIDKINSDNITVCLMTLGELNKLINEKLKINIKIPSSYKLCDFRPCYGKIFEDILEGYDFWGHCDCDLIFGDIRSFFSNDLLEKYDQLMIAGHFQLKKNNFAVNNYYLLERRTGELQRSWKGVLENLDNLELVIAFDEFRGMPAILKEYSIPYYRNLKIYADIKQHADKLVDTRFLNNSILQYWCIDNKTGKLFHCNPVMGIKKELLYIHFGGGRKLKIDPETHLDNEEFLYITADGLVTYRPPKRIQNISVFKQLVPFFFSWLITRIKWQFSEKIV